MALGSTLRKWNCVLIYILIAMFIGGMILFFYPEAVYFGIMPIIFSALILIMELPLASLARFEVIHKNIYVHTILLFGVSIPLFLQAPTAISAVGCVLAGWVFLISALLGERWLLDSNTLDSTKTPPAISVPPTNMYPSFSSIDSHPMPETDYWQTVPRTLHRHPSMGRVKATEVGHAGLSNNSPAHYPTAQSILEAYQSIEVFPIPNVQKDYQPRQNPLNGTSDIV